MIDPLANWRGTLSSVPGDAGSTPPGRVVRLLGPDDLHDYQAKAVWYLIEHYFAALWLDLGLGKTIAALTALRWLLQMAEIKRVLIVAPLRVATSTWPNEIRAWAHTRDLSFTVIRPSPQDPEIVAARALSKEAARRLRLRSDVVTRIAERAATLAEERVRERLLRQPTVIHLINREMVPWIVRKWGKSWPYDALVYDESSGLRDYKTQRVQSLIHVRKKLKVLWELTGTPTPEGYLDLFPQVYLLDGGARFGSSLTAFRAKYFDHNAYAHKFALKDGMADTIIDKIGDLALVLKAEDYLPLNEPVYVDRIVDLSDSELKTYQTLERDLVAMIPSGHEIVVETAGALHQKLLQFASGSVYGDERSVHWVHDHKIEAVQDIIDEAQGQPVIVAYWFKPSLARLKKAFPQGRVIDQYGKVEAEWTKGKVPLLFVHPASAGHGLNLQYGGHYLVFFDIPYSLEYYLQTVGRIARQGQGHVPLVFHICARGTLDQGIVPILRAKGDVQDYLFQRLRVLHRGAPDDHGL